MYKLIVIFLLLTLQINAEDIAIVNGKVITTDDVNYLLRHNGSLANIANLNTSEKLALRERLIEKALFLEASKRNKIEQSPEFVATLARLKDDLLVELWLKKQMNFLIVSDGEARDFYDKNKAKFVEPKNKLIPYERVKPNIVATLKQKQFTLYLSQVAKDMKSKAKIIVPR